MLVVFSRYIMAVDEMVCSLGTNEYNQQWIHSSPKIADSSGVKMGGGGGGGGFEGHKG